MTPEAVQAPPAVAPASRGLPDNLRAVRALLGIQQRDMADRMDVYFGTLNRWETGIARAPDYAATLAIGAAADLLLGHDVRNSEIKERVTTFHKILDILRPAKAK